MKLRNAYCIGLASLTFLISGVCYAGITIPMYMTQANGQGKKIGTVTADDTIYGLLLTPHLKDLPAGLHGFHIHDLPFCNNHGNAAGGHLDPTRTNKHAGPYNGSGHLGDLPVLIVNANGDATLPVLAPRLKLEQIKGHTLMIHAKGDDYTNKSVLGNPRIACGTIPYHN